MTEEELETRKNAIISGLRALISDDGKDEVIEHASANLKDFVSREIPWLEKKRIEDPREYVRHYEESLETYEIILGILQEYGTNLIGEEFGGKNGAD